MHRTVFYNKVPHKYECLVGGILFFSLYQNIIFPANFNHRPLIFHFIYDTSSKDDLLSSADVIVEYFHF